MGSLTSPKSARHHISPFDGVRICLHTGLHAYPRTTIAWAELPSCVTSSLAYYHLRSAAPPSTDPKAERQDHDVSISGFSMGACQRVREYQPVVHRLRLSASP